MKQFPNNQKFDKNHNKSITKNQVSNRKIVSKIELLEKDIINFKDKILRGRAENENLRKRHLNELKDVRKYAITNLSFEIVSHIEDLNRAIENINSKKNQVLSNVEKQLICGLEIVNKNFNRALAKFEIFRIYPKNEKFDFNFHEAVSQISDKSKRVNTILEVVQAGYKIGDRILKPAKVIVSS